MYPLGCAFLLATTIAMCPHTKSDLGLLLFVQPIESFYLMRGRGI